ncbi:MAG: alpha/beta hydrolase domain-containing protein [Bacteroidota bacterium]
MQLRNILILVSILFSSSIQGRVIDLNIISTESVLNGKSFGEVGPYEILRGTVTFELDPTNPANLAICDLDLVQSPETGLVIFQSEIVVLKPSINEHSSGVALVEVSNRGGKFSPSYFNQASKGKLLSPNDPDYFGDGLLMEKGITVVWVGWQIDVPMKEELLNVLNVPVAKNQDGSSIIGKVRSDWTVDETTTWLTLGHGGSVPYAVHEPGSGKHTLTVRTGRDALKRVVPRNEWTFGKVENGEFIEDPYHIYMKSGFDSGNIYELVYESKDPPIVGIGLAVIRDIMSYIKYDPECPFKNEKGIAAGVSQTGRFLRYYLYKGFNTDERKRKVYDGMMIITAGAGRGSFNHRFAQPSRDAHRYSAFYYPTDIFPFSSRPQKEKVSKRVEGLLDNEKRDPKIFYINTGYEYWGRAASLIHTDAQKGKKDVLPFSNERIYHIASGQHFVNNWPLKDDQIMSGNIYRGNHLQFKPNYRALLVRMYEWVLNDKAPPVSRYPKNRNKTLTERKKLVFPEIPGLFTPATIHTAHRVDYGPRWEEGIIDNQPPLVGKPFVSRVSKVDQLGNEIAGIRNVEIVAPLGSYFPWNMRLGQYGGSFELSNFRGTFVPLYKTQNKRFEMGDSRPSIEELYPNKQTYMEKVKAAANQLVYDGFLLSRDQPFVTKRAEAYWDFFNK